MRVVLGSSVHRFGGGLFILAAKTFTTEDTEVHRGRGLDLLMQGSGFRVQGSGVQGSGFGVRGPGVRARTAIAGAVAFFVDGRTSPAERTECIGPEARTERAPQMTTLN